MTFPTDYIKRLSYWLNGFFLTQKDRISLWLPVCFASGIGFYFSLPTEPFLATTLCFFIFSSFLLWDGRKNQVLSVVFLFLFLFCGGIFLTQVRSIIISEPRIKLRTGLLTVTGTVEEVQEFPEGRSRVILDHVSIENYDDWKTPAKIWLNVAATVQPPKTGDVIRVQTHLTDPFPASSPNGFDFSRMLYFQRIGGIGFIQDSFETLKRSEQSDIRDTINRKIDAVMPSDTAGIAKALVTGSSKSVPFNIVENYRDAGIAHILSVSGLHMSLLAGLIFIVVRTLLALIPSVSLYHDTKKIAALISLAVCFCYLQISGASYPAQRAFIMLAFALTAILFNRRALSVVSLAWAAFFILFLFPESLCSAGFQMSFSAVLALICAYEAGIGKYIKLLEKKEGFAFYLLSCVAAVALTTLIASTATAPFTVYHFKRLPVYSLIGNLLSSTLTGFIIMPSLTAGTLLMAFGAEKPFLVLASFGISLINKSAEFTSNLPDAVYQFPPMPFYGLMLAVFSGLWICLWQGRVRLWGIPFFCLSLVTPFLTTLPDIYVSENTFAFKNAAGKLVFNEGTADRVIKQGWLEDYRQKEEITTICPYGLCLYERNGFKIGYAQTKIGAYDGCQMPDTDLLFIPLSFTDTCLAKRTITRDSVAKAGIYTIYINDSGIRTVSVSDRKGFRPWTNSYPLMTFGSEIRNMRTPLTYRIKATIKEHR